MKKTGGLLGALDVEIAQLLVMQGGPGAAVGLHADQVSGEKFFCNFLGRFYLIGQNQECVRTGGRGGQSLSLI